MRRFFAIHIICLCLISATTSQEKNLSERQYEVHPTFGDTGSGNDFFSQEIFEPPKRKGAPNTDFKTILAEHGVKFGENGSAQFDPETNLLTIKTTADQFRNVEFFLDQFARQGEISIYIISEWIETEANRFTRWIADHELKNDATEFRNEVQKWIKSGDADIYDISIVNARSGNRAKAEAAREYQFPIEYSSSEVPEKLSLTNGAKGPVTPVAPANWEMQPLGFTLEADAVIGEPFSNRVDLNIAVSDVQLKDTIKWPNDNVGPNRTALTPSFYEMKTTSVVSIRSNTYTLLGTATPMEPKNPERKKPIILQFVRADTGFTKAWKLVK